MSQPKHETCHGQSSLSGQKPSKNHELRQQLLQAHRAASLRCSQEPTEQTPLVCTRTKATRGSMLSARTSAVRLHGQKKADEGASACRRGDSDEEGSLALHSYDRLTHWVKEPYAHSGGRRRFGAA